MNRGSVILLWPLMHKLLIVVIFRKCAWTLVDPVIRGGSLQMWRQSERDSWLVHQRSWGGWITLNVTISVGGSLTTYACCTSDVLWALTKRAVAEVFSLKPPDVILTLSGSSDQQRFCLWGNFPPKIAWTAEAEGTCGYNRSDTHRPAWRTRDHVSENTAVYAPDVHFGQQAVDGRELAARSDLTNWRGPNTHTHTHMQSSRGTIPLFLPACTVLPWCHTSGPWIPAAQR